MLRRRGVLALGAAGLAAAPARTQPLPAPPPPPLTVAVFGQALIQHDLRAHPWPGLGRFAALFGAADVAFTDLETAIAGPGAGPPTRTGVFAHAAPPDVLDCLRAMNVTMLAQSNNHAFDLNTSGIVAALDAMDARGFAHAGTGRTLAEAASPAVLETRHGRVALVAFASGQVRDGGAATPARPGVNEARRLPGTGPATGLDPGDVSRVLDAVADGARRADCVLCYHHNHLLDPDEAAVPGWQQDMARRSIDAGATMYVSHGAPVLKGVELYRGQPVFYDLGSLVFQSATEEGHYGPEVWQSIVASCRFDGRRFLGASITPVLLNAVGAGGPGDLATRGRPSVAAGAEAQAVIDRLTRASAPFGTRFRPGADGTVELAALA